MDIAPLPSAPVQALHHIAIEIVLRLQRDRGAVMYVEGVRSARGGMATGRQVGTRPDIYAWTEAFDRDKQSDPGFNVSAHLQAFFPDSAMHAPPRILLWIWRPLPEVVEGSGRR